MCDLVLVWPACRDDKAAVPLASSPQLLTLSTALDSQPSSTHASGCFAVGSVDGGADGTAAAALQQRLLHASKSEIVRATSTAAEAGAAVVSGSHAGQPLAAALSSRSGLSTARASTDAAGAESLDSSQHGPGAFVAAGRTPAPQKTVSGLTDVSGASGRSGHVSFGLLPTEALGGGDGGGEMQVQHFNNPGGNGARPFETLLQVPEGDVPELAGGGQGQEEGGQDEELGSSGQLEAVAWHEVEAVPLMDPVTGRQVMLLLQTDITARAIQVGIG